jgi:D-beta-D-heptose 7-phosphate kinase/D-beta-D-heptose 1-phosphate adenosyltransferase
MNEYQTIQQHKQFNVLLIGDDCIDTYIYGHVNRISPEAPVPVFEPLTQNNKPGMAANVSKNLQALGCRVEYLHGQTSEKTRLIDQRSKQQILRIDNDNFSEPMTFASAIPDLYDAIVVSDYNKGTISYELVQELRAEFSGPIFVDTKKPDLDKFNGCYVKINSLEHSRCSTLPDAQWLIVTHGSQGAVHMDQQYPTPTVDVSDVTGAGDTFMSALVYKFLQTQDISQAIVFANQAAGITVQHIGVYAPTLEEIK